MACFRGLVFNLVLLFSLASAQSTINLKNPNAPDVYKNEELQVECTFNITEPSGLDGVAIYYVKDGNKEYAGCVFSFIPGKPRSISELSNSDLPMAGESKARIDECQRVYDELINSGVATLNMNLLPQLPGDYGCSYWGAPIGNEDSDPTIISPLFTKPDSAITATVADGEATYEGNEVNFVCSSTGGDPAPVWSYTLDGILDVSGDGLKFTASRDHSGVKLGCEDMSHENWKGDQPLIKYEAGINVYYLSAPMDSKNDSFNPDHTYELECAVEKNLAEGDSLIYEWYLNSEMVPGETTEVLRVAQTENATSEVYLCVAKPATDTNIQAVTVTFYVGWDVQVSIPTTPAPEPTSTKDKSASEKSEVLAAGAGNLTTIIIIVVVVVILVIIVIIVVIVIVKRRSQQGSAETSKKGETRSPGKEDVEQAKDDGATDKEEQQKLMTNQDKGHTVSEETAEVKTSGDDVKPDTKEEPVA